MPGAPVRPLLIGISVTLSAAAGISIWGWIRIPDHAQAAVQWNLTGETGRFVSKTQALVTMPLLMLAVGALSVVLRMSLDRTVPPTRPRSSRAWRWVLCCTVRSS